MKETSEKVITMAQTQNVRDMIQGWAAGNLGSGGYLRAGIALAEMMDECDDDTLNNIISEATIMQNVTPGWRFSDAIKRAIQSWTEGKPFRYIEANRVMLAEEAQRRLAGQHNYVMPLAEAFPFA